MSQTEILSDLLRINGLFIKCELSSVVDLLRGLNAGDGYDEPIYEVCGVDAHADREISGIARISALDCNPNWVLLEQLGPLEGMQYLLDGWTAPESIAVWSLNDVWWSDPPPGTPVFEKSSTKVGFSYHSSGGFRKWVEHIKNEHDGNQFINTGTLQSFEKKSNYSKKFKKDRINREILFEYLDNLGVDALSVFGCRKVSKSRLYTSDIKGKPCSAFQEERKKVEAIFDSI